jgi:replicative DNA helicase
MGLDSSIHVIREANEARMLRASSARIVQMLDAGVDSEMVKERLLKDVSALPSEGAMGSYNLDQVLGMEDVEKRWVIPGVLAQRERLMLTGNEGSGKSMLLAQIALGAAYGLNPFQPEQVFEPQTVLVLDVENDHEAQLAVNWRKMNAAMRLRAQEVNPNVVLAAARDIDFYNPVEANEFVRLCVRTKPNLVVMGSLYKLTSSSEEFERFARTVQSIVDKIRARTGAAVIIEAHAGHGFQGNRNNGRPDGSSLWLRWPELGIWMKPWRKHSDNPHRVHRMERWRGDRTVRDGIPYGIEMGGTMPWNAIPEDEFEARYGD